MSSDFTLRLIDTDSDGSTVRANHPNIIEAFQPTFALRWADPSKRLSMVPPKEVLSILNHRLSDRGSRTVATLKLSRSIRPGEILPEVKEVFDRIEALLD